MFAGEFIAMVNKGIIKQKIRAGVKDVVEYNMAEARKRVVELLKQFGDRLREKYRVMSVDRYMATHKGRHPTADGHTVIEREIKGQQLQVILFRSLLEGEWDLEYYEDNSVRQKEEVDDGESMLRADQQDIKMTYFQKGVQVAKEGLDIKELPQNQHFAVASEAGVKEEVEADEWGWQRGGPHGGR